MNRSFWSLVISQAQVIIIDNAAKIMLFALAIHVLSAQDGAQFKTVLAGMMILPFVLFAPTLGWICDRFSKSMVLISSLWFQLAIIIFLLLSLQFKSLWIAAVGFFLLGTQAAIFSPAKQGIVKELVGEKLLGPAVSWIELTGFGAILLGSLIGGGLYDSAFIYLGKDPWKAALSGAGILGILTLMAILVSYGINRTPPAKPSEPFRLHLLWEHFGQIWDAWKDRPIRLCILGNSYFIGIGGVLYLAVFEVAQEVAAKDLGEFTVIGRILDMMGRLEIYAPATQAGWFMAMLGVGIMIGGFLITRLAPDHIELGFVPLGAMGLIGGCAALAMLPPTTGFYDAALLLTGLTGAFFVMPINAFLQNRVQPGERGRVLAANNLLMNLMSLCCLGLQLFVSGQIVAKTGWSSQSQFWFYLLPTFVVTYYIVTLLPEALVRFITGFLAKVVYRIKVSGADKLPASGGVLLLPNHISYIDAVVLQLACPRPIRFLMYEDIYKMKALNWAFRLFKAIPVSPRHAKDAIQAATEALKAGQIVCIFPEGQLTRTGTLQKLNRGYELIARKANVPVVPVWLDNLWGSIFSFDQHRFFWKKPKKIPYTVRVFFGKVLAPEVAHVDAVRKELYELSDKAFQSRPELDLHVGYHCIRGLRRNQFRTVVVDGFQQGKEFKGGMLLALGIVFAKWIRQNIKEERVGIILPPGVGVTIANLGCILANKVPVNLNFTAGKAANQSCLSRAEVKSVITADAFAAKLKEFPWPENRIDIGKVLQGLSKPSIILWRLAVLLFPSRFLRSIADVPLIGEQAEAGLLFTSGSSGDPKGVVFTHRNIVANTAQIGAVLPNKVVPSILGCLPIFHSFGFTVTLWWPLISGPKVITYISPLDTGKLAELVQKYEIALMVTTPTFMRGFLRKTEADQLKSLKLVVTGAEKLPRPLLEEFEAKFKVPVCEGYGMTEASPVISVNIISPPKPSPTSTEQTGRLVGSVGRLLPGVGVRITKPETDEEISIFQTGMLWFRGANIFEGYLGDPERSRQVLKNGWYMTGDLGRVDEEGFLHIEGRLSRFSKIAGEMVPHGTVEQKLLEMLDRTTNESANVVIVGVPDESKGEALVAITNVDLDLAAVRKHLTSQGLPNLWIPKRIKKVESIPLLATGKLDLKGCQKLALEDENPAEKV